MASKSKGNSFERETCKRLSLWWSGDDDCVFWRTASSGGRATQRGKQGKKTKNHYGDIGCVDASGQALLDLFLIETKKGYNKATIHDLIDRDKNAKEQQYEEWIRKLTDGCGASGVPFWLLIHKRDRREAMVYMPLKAWAALFDLVKEPAIQANVKVDGIRYDITGCKLEWLLDNVSRQGIEELAGKKGK